MHIPDSMLHGTVCPVSATVAVIGVVGAVYLAKTAKERPTAARFAAISALIFALQMMNFPISDGTSGHLLGGVLAAALLGTPFGVLSIALVVTIQALVFSDGGLTVLGANVLNMALLGAGVGGLLNAKLRTAGLSRTTALALASWFSVVLASFAVCVELAVGGVIGFTTVSAAMLGTHALIGIGEMAITLLCLQLLSMPKVSHSERMHTSAPLLAASVIAFMLSPFASGFPDGLEWVAGRYNFLHESAPAFVGIMPDYIFPLISSEAFATSMAGLAGVTLTFAVSWVLLRMLGSSAPQTA
jgi:cobalt/nickel transport system permease protein